MKRKSLLSLILAGVLSIAAVPVHADPQDEINARINGLTAQKAEMENYLSSLNSQYETLTKSVDKLTIEAAEKAEELKKLKIRLHHAKMDRLEQYEKMKLRLSYMYEKGGNSWLNTLMESRNLSEFVDRAEYIVKMAEYDREMLEKYEKVQNDILEEEQAMQKEVDEINALLAQSNEKRQKIRDLAASTEDSIYSYAQEITDSQYEAETLVAQFDGVEEQQYPLLISVESEEPAAEYIETVEEPAGEAAEVSYTEEDYSVIADDTQEYAESTEEEIQIPEISYDYDAVSGMETEEYAADTYVEEIPQETFSQPEGAVYDSATGLYTVTVVYGDQSAQGDGVISYVETTVQEPDYEAPTYEEPSYEEPSYEEPSYEEPSYEEPSYEEPVLEEPAADGGQGNYLGNFTLTAYCGCASCCGVAGQPTASGAMPVQGRTVAMGGVPFGTQLMINGYVYTVEDLGTPYGHVDIYFDSHEAALAFGRQSADVYQVG